MPMVNGKKYSYDKKGMVAAKKAKKKAAKKATATRTSRRTTGSRRRVSGIGR